MYVLSPTQCFMLLAIFRERVLMLLLIKLEKYEAVRRGKGVDYRGAGNFKSLSKKGGRFKKNNQCFIKPPIPVSALRLSRFVC